MIHQMLTIHSCTFRTAAMRKWGEDLPKHVFYEDNLMVYKTLPHVQRMYYMNADLYRYWIGRPDQSVQQNVMTKRYQHQILVTEKCFTSCHLDDITEPRLKRYMKHELFMMFGISILFTRLNKSKETDEALEKMWENCIAFDEKFGRHFKSKTPLLLICRTGTAGQEFSGLVYKIANKVVRFN